MLSDKKIDIKRRSSVTTASSTGWALEIFNVTETTVSTGKVTLSQAPIGGSDIVTLNGLLVHRSPDWDYQILGQQITFNAGHNLTAGDTIRIKYQIQT